MSAISSNLATAIYGTYAPTFELYVDGNELKADVTQHVLDVEFEHTLDIASRMTIAIENRGGRFGGHPLFFPGRSVDLFLGYSGANDFVGRAELTRHLPRFPQNEFPVLELRGFDRSWRLGEKEVVAIGAPARRPPKPLEPTAMEGDRLLAGSVLSVVEDRLKKYGIVPDVDLYYDSVLINNTQDKGTSDLEVVRGLASLYNARFWVEWALPPRWQNFKSLGLDIPTLQKLADFQWVGRFRQSANTQNELQEVVYDFKYGEGDDSSIISIELDWGLPDVVTDLAIYVFDPRTHEERLIVADMPAEAPPPRPRPKRKHRHGRKAGESPQKQIVRLRTRNSRNKQHASTIITTKRDVQIPPEISNPYAVDPFIEEAWAVPGDGNYTELRIGLGGNSIKLAAPPFAKAEDAAHYALRWFNNNRDNFVTAQGTVVGEPSLRAGQVHHISGIGEGLSGDYELTSVRHRFNVDEGYLCHFTANKVFEDEEP